MPPETHVLTYAGRPVTAVLDHASALDLLRVAGEIPPPMPAGCNTVLHSFTTAGGQRALAIGQTGFQPVRDDDERQVNGWSVLILQATPIPDDADAVLDSFYQSLCG